MGVKWSVVKQDFNFNSITDVYFRKSEWEEYDPHDQHTSVSIFYVGYRLLFMSYFVGATIEYFLCGDKYPGLYLIYLTNQTFTLQLIYSVLFFLYVVWVYFKRNSSKRIWMDEISHGFHQEDYTLPPFCKILWILINIVQSAPYIVTLLYWVFLFDEEKYGSQCAIVDNALFHAFNAFLAFADTCIIAVPTRRTHIIFPIAYGLSYASFTLLYEVFGGQYADDQGFIYPILDWKQKPGYAVVTTIFALALGVIFHFFLGWGVYRLRIYLKSKLFSRSTDVDYYYERLAPIKR